MTTTQTQAQVFTSPKQIRFQHCDPAGIVFYPQFFILLHEAQEDFFAHIGFPEDAMIRSGFGVPMVKMNTDFLIPSRNGDRVVIEMRLNKLGNSSIGVDYTLLGVNVDDSLGAPRLKASSVNAYMNLNTGRAVPIPDNLKAAMGLYLHVL